MSVEAKGGMVDVVHEVIRKSQEEQRRSQAVQSQQQAQGQHASIEDYGGRDRIGNSDRQQHEQERDAAAIHLKSTAEGESSTEYVVGKEKEREREPVEDYFTPPPGFNTTMVGLASQTSTPRISGGSPRLQQLHISTSTDPSSRTRSQLSALTPQTGTPYTSSPMRGPFTRADSERGSQILRYGSDMQVLHSPSRRKSSLANVWSGSRDSGRRRSVLATAPVRHGTADSDGTARIRRGTEGDTAMNSEEDRRKTKDASQEPNLLMRILSEEPKVSEELYGQLGSPGIKEGGASLPGSPKRDRQDSKDSGEKHGLSKAGWSAIRQRFVSERGSTSVPPTEEPSAYLSGENLLTDLTVPLLPLAMLKMSLTDRDEHNKKRIPILMNYLKLRITDSAHALSQQHAVFRIELEYGDGLLKWVVYRELSDFWNLHTRYKVANLRHEIPNLPNFPKVGLPYWNFLKGGGGTTDDYEEDEKDGEEREKTHVESGKEISKEKFSRMQREKLEIYLLKLIRAVMFRPEANRLCKFLEISALSIQLATAGAGSIQGKQGYLSVHLSGSSLSGISRKGVKGFHPLQIKKKHDPKWFLVRESYIVCVDEPDDPSVYDIILFDSDFELERPKRLYKQGLHLLQNLKDDKGGDDAPFTEDLKSDPSAAAQEGDIPAEASFSDPSSPNSPSKPAKKKSKDTSSHTFYVKNSERRLRLGAKNERQMDQFAASIEQMAKRSIWTKPNRFGSFAPIRMNVEAQWLVDGRDYFWNLSKAILMAKESIYIHDWWLSPELYLRRPAATNEKWRLDNLLQRKAREGVQIFVIVYKEVSNDFTPVESNYTKQRLLGLHRNIHVQRSPSHGLTPQFWSHHEKMCVIDQTIAFMGGLDMCFGRWDTSTHVMTDDGPTGMGLPKEEVPEDAQIWLGKDYSNGRVSDFFTLTKPEEDMYDRTKVPRQPWHDIGLQLVGQPARDLGRHFVQRWNFLLRTKNHTRLMPFLIPPPDFTPLELAHKRIFGTCETQICRSASPWSIGTPNKVEHSIQTAYIKAIQLSDHFVYIENQFFISSTLVEGVVIENRIADALVSRIIKAYHEGTPWRAVILIPLEPGYPASLDSAEAGSVRLILECQNRTICRGEHSIFERLRKEGIEPDDYIAFFGLRGWGKLKNGSLTSEAIYIHAKCMVVDDRIAIIGSANINERSQRGDRDSELACVIRDTDMVNSTMAGNPYKVGRFAHGLRVRLMREHLGIDTDEMEAKELGLDLHSRDSVRSQSSNAHWESTSTQYHGSEGRAVSRQDTNEIVGNSKDKSVSGHSENFVEYRPSIASDELSREAVSVDGHDSQSHTGTFESGQTTPSDPRTKTADQSTPRKFNRDVEDDKKPKNPILSLSIPDRDRGRERSASVVSTASMNVIRHEKISSHNSLNYRARSNIHKPFYSVPQPRPHIDPLGFEDPLDEHFYDNVWMASAQRNTAIFKKVFKCMPDDSVLTWSQFRDWQRYMERHNIPIKGQHPDLTNVTSDPSTSSTLNVNNSTLSIGVEVQPPTVNPTTNTTQSQEDVGLRRDRAASVATALTVPGIDELISNQQTQQSSELTGSKKELLQTPTQPPPKNKGGKPLGEGFSVEEMDQMENLLDEVIGQLVIYPTRFLESEDLAGNFLFQKDRLPPLSIYN